MGEGGAGDPMAWLPFAHVLLVPLLLRQRSVSGIGSSEETRLQFLRIFLFVPNFNSSNKGEVLI